MWLALSSGLLPLQRPWRVSQLHPYSPVAQLLDGPGADFDPRLLDGPGTGFDPRLLDAPGVDFDPPSTTADIYGYLLGVWNVRRSMTYKAGGMNGRFEGTATFGKHSLQLEPSL